jgi:hypothetical protein
MSSITVRNATDVPVEFVVAIEDHVLGRPCVPRGGEAAVATDIYQVTAATLLSGNTYMTAPVDAAPGTGFLAEMLETFPQGTYEFTLSAIGAPPGEFSFQKAAFGPVTFTIAKLGTISQDVVVTDALLHKIPAPLDVAGYSVAAVVNGIVTASTLTAEPNATVTLFEGNVSGEYALVTQ